MASFELIIHMKYRWWLEPTIWTYFWTCMLIDVEPDYDLIEDVMWRACIVKMSGGSWRPLLEVLSDAELL